MEVSLSPDAAPPADSADGLDLVRELEAKRPSLAGLEKIYRLVLHHSARFRETGLLPARPHLTKQSGLKDAQVAGLLAELLGRGKFNRAALIGVLPALELDRQQGRVLRRTVCFGFPLPELEHGRESLRRDFSETNAAVLREWFQTRRPLAPEALLETLRTQFDSGRLAESTAGGELRRAFATEFDSDPEQQRASYLAFGQPALQRLIEDGTLLARRANTPRGQLTHIYRRNAEELAERYQALSLLFVERYAGPSREAGANLNLRRPGGAAVREYIARNANRERRPVEWQLFTEILALEGLLAELSAERSEGAEGLRATRARAAEIEARIKAGKERLPRNLGALVPDLDDALWQELRRRRLLLTAEYPMRGRAARFALFVDHAPEAFREAKKRFKKTGDAACLQILALMKADRLLDDSDRRSLHKLLKESEGGGRSWLDAVRAAFSDAAPAPAAANGSGGHGRAGAASSHASQERRPASGRETADARRSSDARSSGEPAAPAAEIDPDAPPADEARRSNPAADGASHRYRLEVSREDREGFVRRLEAEQERGDARRRAAAEELARKLRK